MENETLHERKHVPLVQRYFFSWPNNTRLLLTQDPGQWHSTLQSSFDYISPVAVNI